MSGKEKKKAAAAAAVTVPDCVARAVEKTLCLLDSIEPDGAKDAVALLEKLVGIIGKLREMDPSSPAQTGGVVILPAPLAAPEEGDGD